MSLESKIILGADNLDRHVNVIVNALEDETAIPGKAIITAQEDISVLRKHLDELEQELTAIT